MLILLLFCFYSFPNALGEPLAYWYDYYLTNLPHLTLHTMTLTAFPCIGVTIGRDEISSEVYGDSQLPNTLYQLLILKLMASKPQMGLFINVQHPMFAQCLFLQTFGWCYSWYYNVPIHFQMQWNNLHIYTFG